MATSAFASGNNDELGNSQPQNHQHNAIHLLQNMQNETNNINASGGNIINNLIQSVASYGNHPFSGLITNILHDAQMNGANNQTFMNVLNAMLVEKNPNQPVAPMTLLNNSNNNN